MLKILIAEDDRELRHLRSVGNIPCVGDYRQNAFDDMRMDFRIGVDDDMIKPINVNEMVLLVGGCFASLK